MEKQDLEEKNRSELIELALAKEAEAEKALAVTNERLQHITAKLRVEQQALNSKNLALNELISNIEDERDQVKKAINLNFERIIFPLIDKIRIKSGSLERSYLDLLKVNLEEIAAPFFPKDQGIINCMTPKEFQICNMIKNGLSAKEIADFLHLSPRTVGKHRENIRKKLGITSRKINLVSYLSAHM